MSTAVERPQPCQCLRTKNPYGMTPQDVENWIPGFDTSSSYWCLRTMGPAGPDELHPTYGVVILSSSLARFARQTMRRICVSVR
jgi:hypothetical protein